MRKRTKWAALGLAAALFAGSILGGCGRQEGAGDPQESSTQNQQAVEGSQADAAEEEETQEESQEEPQAPAIDTSQKVDLVFYLVGDEPEDMARVEEKINEILLERINATITFNFTSWTDYTNKYAMVLNGGEDCDIIYTATWLQFNSLVNKGAFLDLNDYIDQYGPKLKEAISPEILAQVDIGGHLYCIPTTYAEYEGGDFMYREDLRKKYDLPVPDSLENIEAYMQGIKDNEPDMEVTLATTAYMALDLNHPSIYPTDGAYGLRCPYESPSEPSPYYGSEEHLEDLKLTRRWAEAGFWSKSGMADLGTDGVAAFENGRIALLAYGMNPSKYVDTKIKLAGEHPDWEIGHMAYADIIGVAYPQSYLGNGTAIPQNSKNPERAMMAIELLFTDEELNHLLLYGIEGEHYQVDAEGYYESIEGSKYDFEASNAWNFRNADLMLTRKENQELQEIFNHMEEVSSKMKYPNTNIKGGYAGEVQNKNASAAFFAALDEYLTPVNLGMVEDVEGGLEKFMEEAKKVGMEELQEEFKALWCAYCEEKGYK